MFGETRMRDGTKKDVGSFMADLVNRGLARAYWSKTCRFVYCAFLVALLLYLAYDLPFRFGFRDKALKRAMIGIYNGLELGMALESARKVYTEERMPRMTMRQLATFVCPIWSLGLTFESNHLVHADIHDLSESNRMAVYRDKIPGDTIDPTGVEKGRPNHAVGAEAAPQHDG